MSKIAILAASYLSAAGHGNDLTGLRPWPHQFQPAFNNGDLSALHWSMLFASDPARFARMDLMSRLGLMATELLDAGLENLPSERRDQVGVLVETNAGSLATDLCFLQTPRASLFAYTLPSTAIGEICIRYRLRGPVLCLPGSGALEEAVHWLNQGDAAACLCVACEAIDCDTASVFPEFAPPGRWHTAALLLGKEKSTGRSHSVMPGSLPEICRQLCERRA